MRFRKRIKIAKGVNLNLSKSGVSTSFGMKGMSLSVGNKGSYVNYGIPGTGLYDRKKISSSSSNPVNKNQKIYEEINLSLQLKIADSGDIQVLDSEGELIEDKSLLRKIKATPEYTETAETLKNKKIEEIQKANDQFINIYQLTPSLKSELDWKNEYNSLVPIPYVKKEFDVPEPTVEDSISQLEEFSKKEVKSVLFWKNDSKRQKYIDQNLESFHQERLKKWQTEMEQFLEEELQRKKTIEKENQNIMKLKKEIEDCVFLGKPDYIDAKIEEVLSTLTLPVEFSVDFDFQEPDRIKLDLDLPEIEDLPTEQANLLSSGKLSVKQKTKKQILQDYAICVHGLAFFFAGLLFNTSPKISQIEIAGYTQRLDSKTGNIKDTYIYFVEINRDLFGKLNVPQLNPVDAFENFNHQRRMLKSFEMKEIDFSEHFT